MLLQFDSLSLFYSCTIFCWWSAVPLWSLPLHLYHFRPLFLRFYSFPAAGSFCSLFAVRYSRSCRVSAVVRLAVVGKHLLIDTIIQRAFLGCFSRGVHCGISIYALIRVYPFTDAARSKIRPLIFQPTRVNTRFNNARPAQ